MRRRWPCVVSAVALITGVAVDAKAITGNEYRALSDGQRLSYVVGVFDGWGILTTTLQSVKVEVPLLDQMFQRVVDCAMNRMTKPQVRATVDKFMNDHPEAWQYNAGSTAWVAMNEACKP
jgi:hypothetical protein